MYEAGLPVWRLEEERSKELDEWWQLDKRYVILYLCGFSVFALIWHSFHDIGLSTLLTFSVLVQILALAALLYKLFLYPLTAFKYWTWRQRACVGCEGLHGRMTRL